MAIRRTKLGPADCLGCIEIPRTLWWPLFWLEKALFWRVGPSTIGRWWFQILFIFTPILGKWSNLIIITESLPMIQWFLLYRSDTIHVCYIYLLIYHSKSTKCWYSQIYKFHGSHGGGLNDFSPKNSKGNEPSWFTVSMGKSKNHQPYPGWWFHPIWKICSSNWIISLSGGWKQKTINLLSIVVSGSLNRWQVIQYILPIRWLCATYHLLGEPETTILGKLKTGNSLPSEVRALLCDGGGGLYLLRLSVRGWNSNGRDICNGVVETAIKRIYRKISAPTKFNI